MNASFVLAAGRSCGQVPAKALRHASKQERSLAHLLSGTRYANNDIVFTSSRRDFSSSPALRDVYTWGTNANGNLLDPSLAEKTAVLEPAKASLEGLPAGAKIKSVECGATDTAVLLDDGSVYVVGTNKYGQLGLGHTDVVPKLTKVPGVEGIEKVRLGVVSSALIDKYGFLYTSGSNGTVVSGLGLLGLGLADASVVTSFTKVDSLVEDGCITEDATWGDSHLTVLTTEGEVLTAGASNYGRLGTGDTSIDQCYLEPVLDVGVGLTNTSAVAVAGGKSFTLALNQEGIIYSWGRNHKGQLGTGFGMAVDMYAMEESPQPVNDSSFSAHELATSGQKVVQIAAGSNHAAAITDSGGLFWWGMSVHLEPTKAIELTDEYIIQVACGNDATLALAESGRVYAWGKQGMLGIGAVSGTLGPGTSHQPVLLPSTSDSLSFTSLSAGWTHAAGIAEIREEEAAETL